MVDIQNERINARTEVHGPTLIVACCTQRCSRERWTCSRSNKWWHVLYPHQCSELSMQKFELGMLNISGPGWVGGVGVVECKDSEQQTKELRKKNQIASLLNKFNLANRRCIQLDLRSQTTEVTIPVFVLERDTYRLQLWG